MKNLIALSTLLFSSLSLAELVALNENNLSQVSGQSGITIDTDQHLTIDEISYSEDGNAFTLNDIEVGRRADVTAAADIIQKIDINSAGLFQYSANQSDGRINIGSISFADDATKTLGGLTLAFDDFDLVVQLGSGGQDGQGLHGYFSNQLSDGQVSWLSNGKSLDFVTSELSIQTLSSGNGFTLDIENTSNQAWLALRLDDLQFALTDAQMQLGSNSFGVLNLSFVTDTDLFVTGGGAVGTEGMSLRMDSVISNGQLSLVNDNDRGLVLEGISAELHVRDANLDVIDTSYTLPDMTPANALLLTVGEAWGSLALDDIKVGAVAATNNSLGGFRADLSLEDSLFSLSASQDSDDGLHFFSKLGLAHKAGSGANLRQNSFTWITNKTSATDWSEWDFVNIYTSDGLGSINDNSYGLQADLDIALTEADFDGVTRDSIAINSQLRFKELVVDSVDLVTVAGGAVVDRQQDHGLIFQNFNVAANTTITPIP